MKRGSTYVVHLNVEQATSTRDALAKVCKRLTKDIIFSHVRLDCTAGK